MMTKKAKAKKAKSKKSKRGPPRKCGFPGCGQVGHTARSHEPGGRLAT